MKEKGFESDDFKEILNKYEASRAQGNTCYLDADDFADIADYYLSDGKADEGLEAVNRGLDLHIDSGMLQSVKSAILIYKRQYVEAKEILDNLVDDTNDYDVLYQRAQLTYALYKDVDKAEEMFREWIALQEKEEISLGNSPTGEFMRESYTHVITSFIELVDDGRYDEELVKRWIEEYIVTFQPLGNSNSDLLLADIVRDEEMADMVDKVYSLLLETDPYIKYGWTVLAAAQNSEGKYYESNDSCDFALAINPDDWDAKIIKAHNYYSLSDMEKALPLFQEVMEKFDDSSQSLPYAICLLACNRIEEGDEQLRRAYYYADSLKYKDKYFYASLLGEIAEGCIVSGNYKMGMNAINKAIECQPSEPNFYMCKGTLMLINDDVDGAMTSYSDYIEYSNDKIIASANIALRLIFQEKEDLAMSLLDTCYEYGKDSKSWRIISAYKAFAFYRFKHYDDFLTELKTACESCPDIVGALFADIIPSGMDPKDYYDYIVNKPL
ncbi:MAG: hypothetical protein K6E54_07700 [Bacteroidaceae bacterium]|nr:hypothetical protein [Bacteroidaceae bacterium]